MKIGNPYLKMENWLAGRYIKGLRLLEVWVENNIVYLKIQDLETTKVDTITYNLLNEGDFWLWSLTSLNYTLSMTGKKDTHDLNDEELPEFDF